MTTRAVAAIGTLVKIGTATVTDPKVVLPGVKDIDGPKFATSSIDVTSHDTVGGYDETIAGSKTGGTIDFNMNYYQGDYAQMLLFSYFSALPTTRFYVDVVLPPDLDNLPAEDRTETYCCDVAALGKLMPVKGVLERRVSLRVIGAPIHMGS